MKREEFKTSVKKKSMPDDLRAELRAMWVEGRGDWDTAHRIVQDLNSKEAAWVHAYLHRKEGDESNAAYWYTQAGRDVPTSSLDEEWDEIVRALL